MIYMYRNIRKPWEAKVECEVREGEWEVGWLRADPLIIAVELPFN